MLIYFLIFLKGFLRKLATNIFLNQRSQKILHISTKNLAEMFVSKNKQRTETIPKVLN